MAGRSPAISRYPAELEGEISLRDGTRVEVRPIRAGDVALEKAFFDGLSERSRYQRFMHHITELPPGMLKRFTQLDYERELALVALSGGRFIAVGRYAPSQDEGRAEFALVVADDWQRRGLGRILLEKLKAEARRAGYHTLCGTVLESNHEMLELTRRLGFTVEGRDGAYMAMATRLI